MKVVTKPIDTIATFNKEGKPVPIKFRLEKEDGSVVIVNVEHVKYSKLEKFGGNKMMIFSCRSTINNTAVLYEIKYELDTMKWILFKI